MGLTPKMVQRILFSLLSSHPFSFEGSWASPAPGLSWLDKDRALRLKIKEQNLEK